MKKKILLLLLFGIFLFLGCAKTSAINIDFLDNPGNQLQPPQGIPKNNISSSASAPTVQTTNIPNFFEELSSAEKNQPSQVLNSTKEYNKGINWLLCIAILSAVILVALFIVALLMV